MLSSPPFWIGKERECEDTESEVKGEGQQYECGDGASKVTSGHCRVSSEDGLYLPNTQVPTPHTHFIGIDGSS